MYKNQNKDNTDSHFNQTIGTATSSSSSSTLSAGGSSAFKGTQQQKID
jgi:hypothetical protein